MFQIRVRTYPSLTSTRISVTRNASLHVSFDTNVY